MRPWSSATKAKPPAAVRPLLLSDGPRPVDNATIAARYALFAADGPLARIGKQSTALFKAAFHLGTAGNFFRTALRVVASAPGVPPLATAEHIVAVMLAIGRDRVEVLRRDLAPPTTSTKTNFTSRFVEMVSLFPWIAWEQEGVPTPVPPAGLHPGYGEGAGAHAAAADAGWSPDRQLVAVPPAPEAAYLSEDDSVPEGLLAARPAVVEEVSDGADDDVVTVADAQVVAMAAAAAASATRAEGVRIRRAVAEGMPRALGAAVDDAVSTARAEAQQIAISVAGEVRRDVERACATRAEIAAECAPRRDVDVLREQVSAEVLALRQEAVAAQSRADAAEQRIVASEAAVASAVRRAVAEADARAAAKIASLEAAVRSLAEAHHSASGWSSPPEAAAQAVRAAASGTGEGSGRRGGRPTVATGGGGAPPRRPPSSSSGDRDGEASDPSDSSWGSGSTSTGSTASFSDTSEESDGRSDGSSQAGGRRRRHRRRHGRRRRGDHPSSTAGRDRGRSADGPRKRSDGGDRVKIDDKQFWLHPPAVWRRVVRRLPRDEKAAVWVELRSSFRTHVVDPLSGREHDIADGFWIDVRDAINRKLSHRREKDLRRALLRWVLPRVFGPQIAAPILSQLTLKDKLPADVFQAAATTLRRNQTTAAVASDALNGVGPDVATAARSGLAAAVAELQVKREPRRPSAGRVVKAATAKVPSKGPISDEKRAALEKALAAAQARLKALPKA